MAKEKNTTNITNSDVKAQEILSKITIIECSTLVPPPSSFGGSNSNFTCGNGTFDLGKMTADTLLNRGHIWTNSGGLHIDSRHPIITHKGSGGYGQCTSCVAGHIQSGGIKWTSGRVGYGYEQKDIIGQMGFNEVPTILSQINTYNGMDNWTSNNARVGDVCVMTHSTNSWSTSSPGHACIWNGNNWVSDFVQDHALVYKPHNTPYNGVKIFRYTDCQNSYSSTDSTSSDVSDESEDKTSTAGIKATKAAMPSKSAIPLVMTFTITRMGNYYCYGTFNIGNSFKCSACIPGKFGSLCNKGGKNSGRILVGEYQVYFELANGWQEYVKDNDKYCAPEFAYFFKNILGKVQKGKLFFPSLKKVTYMQTFTSKIYNNGNSFKILPGRGSTSTKGSIILGPSTKNIKEITDYDSFYFMNEKPKSTNKQDLIKQYLNNWNIYNTFYDICLNTYKSIGSKIGTLIVKYEC